MIDPFEVAVADLLADRAGAHPAVGSVRRAGVAGPVATDGTAGVSVGVVDAVAGDEVGVDRDERVSRTIERRSHRLTGRVRIALTVGPAGGPAGDSLRRANLWQAADMVLVVVHQPDVRDGSVWGADHEQGFAIDRFRLASVGEPTPPDTAGADRLDIWCDYAGRFWPVDPLVEGDIIVEPVPTRLLVHDTELPTGLFARAGGAELAVPLHVDVRTFDATPRLVARLGGAAPPGELLGDEDGAPPGWFGYPPDEHGTYTILFRPAAAIAAPADARVLLGLASADRPTVSIGELQIEVLP